MSLLFAETQATDSRNGLGKLVTFCFQVADTKIITPCENSQNQVVVCCHRRKSR
jgi:hypothetical protein